MRLEVYTDGGARGNPGPAAVGFVIKQNGKVIHQQGEAIGDATNNIAEYTAVLKAMNYLVNNLTMKQPACQCLKAQPMAGRFNNRAIIFYMDSKLVVEQLSGRYKIKNPVLKNLWRKIKILEDNLKAKVSYQNIPRFLNQQADALVNVALDDTI